MENIMKISQKLQIKLPYDIAIPLLGIYLKKTNLLIPKDTCTPNFHSTSIYKCQNMETTSMSINRWMDKYVVCIYTHTHTHIHTQWNTAAAAKSLQSCPTLCDPIDGSPPGSSVPGILQARTLECVAISYYSVIKRD